jgi:hypothetical protein
MPSIPTIVLNFNQGNIGILLGGFLVVKDSTQFLFSDLVYFSFCFGIFIASAQFFFMTGFRLVEEPGKYTLV